MHKAGKWPRGGPWGDEKNRIRSLLLSSQAPFFCLYSLLFIFLICNVRKGQRVVTLFLFLHTWASLPLTDLALPPANGKAGAARWLQPPVLHRRRARLRTYGITKGHAAHASSLTVSTAHFRDHLVTAELYHTCTYWEKKQCCEYLANFRQWPCQNTIKYKTEMLLVFHGVGPRDN